MQENDRFVFRSAEKFGTLIFLQPFYQIQTADQAETAADHMAAKLEDFNSDHDYLLLVGDPILIALAASLVSHNTNGLYKILKWDREDSKYNPVTLDLGVV